jgi:hypothetical protein
MLISQYSLQIANPWENADKILTHLFQERAQARAKKNKKQRPASSRRPESGKKFWRSEQRKQPRPQRRVLYPI